MEMLARPEPFLGGIDFGEAPRWHDGRLWYSDFYQHTVNAASPDGTVEVIVEVPGQPSGLGWMPGGDLLVVSMLDRRVLHYDGTTLGEHADLSALATSHCNDMTVDTQGRAYVGNFGFDLHEGEDVAGATLGLVQPDGTVEAAAGDLLFPNGAVITPDGAKFIVGESFASQFTAFDIGAGGRLENRRLWAAVPGTIPDGCCYDAEEGIWYADAVGCAAQRVIEGGEITHRVETEQNCFAVMLGGDDRRTLFLLTAPGSHPDEVRGRGQARIETVRVEVPGAGLP
ncbi:SMP-30/gluconolactonase/LRE family protein [Candidatus Poriferisocius sp.]|uniref:SMP-30/gluconolactonase/LRE family protein n=1 Tax=Candidatus Poriferisocius sp. TaxID=3101276 RepID=UPI003B01F73F